MENLKNTEFLWTRCQLTVRAKKVGKIQVHYFVNACSAIFLMCSLSHPLSDLFSLSCNRAVLWQCLVAPCCITVALG